MADRFPDLSESDLTTLVDQKNSDRMIKQLLNLVIAKYRDLSVSRRSIICLSLRLRQIIDLLAADKSRFFVKPRSIIVNYLQQLFLFAAAFLFVATFFICSIFFSVLFFRLHF